MSNPERATGPLEANIGLALSGGGSRAIAFHLGCLRAPYEAGLLDRVATISSIPGGSVVAALYCTTPGGFDAFEVQARGMLAQGLVRPSIQIALTTTDGLKPLGQMLLLASD